MTGTYLDCGDSPASPAPCGAALVRRRIGELADALKAYSKECKGRPPAAVQAAAAALAAPLNDLNEALPG